MNANDLRRHLRAADASLAVAEAQVDQMAADHPELLKSLKPGQSSTRIPRPKLGSGKIPVVRPNQTGPRTGNDVATRTPLPNEIPLTGFNPAGSELARLQAENAELRLLIDQAIAQEEENERRTKEWLDRESEYVRRINTLEEQVQLLKSGAGEAGDLIVRLQERDEAVRVLTEQVQQLELHLQYVQETASAADVEQYQAAIRERDQMVEELTARVADLEKQLASIPPPPPTDEELARMADELDRERAQITRMKKELEEERRQYLEEEAEFEKQIRDMEVQLSKERAEVARQRVELNRRQAEMRSDFEAAQRSDPLRDRLAALQQRQQEPGAAQAAPVADTRQSRDSGFISRLFGKK